MLKLRKQLKKGKESVSHQSNSDLISFRFRFLTVMYFLNDVEDGELVFPLADNKTLCWDVSSHHLYFIIHYLPSFKINLIYSCSY